MAAVLKISVEVLTMHKILILAALLVISVLQLSVVSGAEIPLASTVYAWKYNPAGEPAWLEGNGLKWIQYAIGGWERCGISFLYRGETNALPGTRDMVNVIGWDKTLGKGQRGITRSFVNKAKMVAIERDVAYSPDRKEFRLHPVLLRKVIAHELGHVAGLGHADNCDDVMSFGSNCRDVNPDGLPVLPTDNDIARCVNFYK